MTLPETAAAPANPAAEPAASQAHALEQRAEIAAARGDFESAYRFYVSFHEAAVAAQTAEQLAEVRRARDSFDAEQSRRDAERYRELAMRDPLTGLHNRRYLQEFLARAVAESRAAGTALSAAIVDADFFKRVNDSLSHKAGDQVLCTLAAVLSTVAPDGSEVCRLGGEEFVLVMPGLAELAAFDACERARLSVASFDWEGVAQSVPVTVSIGVTTAIGGRTSPSALLADADRNLYAAKRTGRNKVMGDAVTRE